MSTPPQSREEAKRIVEQWKRAAPLLEKIREEDIRRTDTAASIGVFDDVLEDALIRFPPEPTSGMIEMQRYFMRGYQREQHERKANSKDAA